MPSTYTQNLLLEKPATGEQAGVWGNTANTSYDSIDMGVNGNKQLALSASTYQLDTPQGAPGDGRNKVITWTGSPTQAATVNLTPNTAQKYYLMVNATSQPVTFQQGSGGAYTIQSGYAAYLISDGAGPTARVAAPFANPQFNNMLVQGNVLVNGLLTFGQAQSFTQPMTFAGAMTFTGAVTASSLTIALAGAAPYDLYYRSPAGTVTSLPIGAAGQLLEVTGSGTLAWASVSLSIGSGVSGSIANAVYYSSAANVLSQDSRINIGTGGLGIGIAAPGHALHLSTVIGTQSPEIWHDTTNAAAATLRQTVWATNGSPRWSLGSPAAAETGSNVGSDLVLGAFNDGGALLGYAWSAIRATGNFTIGAYADEGARLAVVSSNAAQPTIVARGASGQQYLQQWQNSSGTTVASIDGNGNLVVSGGGFLQLNASGRLDLHGAIAGHPWGTIHIGRETISGGPAGIVGSIAMEVAGVATDQVPANLIRFYYRSNSFVIQFSYNAVNYYAYLNLVGQNGPVQWGITSTVL